MWRARCAPPGVAAICFDQRGHGESDGALGAGALDDVATMAALLPPGPIALRGSSMGGFMALMASTRMPVVGVVAICPATAGLLARGLRTGALLVPRRPRRHARAADAADEAGAAAALGERLLLMHAEGDEQVPISVSRELHAAAPGSRLIAVPAAITAPSSTTPR
jgi:pimeloyl-ACP methyl ester carboxylesterase